MPRRKQQQVEEAFSPARIATMANADLLTLTSIVQELEKHRASLSAELKKNLSVSPSANRPQWRASRASYKKLEGGSPVEFVSRLLQTVVGNDIFPEPPELDRAHRTLTPKPAAGQRPRAILARFLRYQDKERVLRRARYSILPLLQRDSDWSWFSNWVPFVTSGPACLVRINLHWLKCGPMGALLHFKTAGLKIT